jgi:hypothetical protein
MSSAVCREANGFSGGCPLLKPSTTANFKGSSFGVCSDTNVAYHRFNKYKYVSKVEAWSATQAGSLVVSAVRVTFQDGVEQTIGDLEITVLQRQATASISVALVPVTSFRLWYAKTMDSADRAQLGRLFIRAGTKFIDVGDTSLPYTDAALVLEEADPDEQIKLGTGFLYGLAGSTGSPAKSINALFLLLLPPPSSTGASIKLPNFASKDVEVNPSNIISSTIDNTRSSTSMSVLCTEMAINVEESDTYTESSSYES